LDIITNCPLFNTSIITISQKAVRIKDYLLTNSQGDIRFIICQIMVTRIPMHNSNIVVRVIPALAAVDYMVPVGLFKRQVAPAHRAKPPLLVPESFALLLALSL
jgi:hypothetical protein